jgi:hypothetical protein
MRASLLGYGAWVAVMSFHPILAVLFAWIIASIMSMGGISGAFLLLPFQVSVLGLTGPAVTPTNHLYNVVAIPIGVARYVRERRMLWPLTLVIIAGTLPGVILGSLIRISLLPDARNFKLFMGLVLVLIGSRLLARVLRRPDAAPSAPESFIVRTLRFDWQRFIYSFQGQSHDVSVPHLLLLTTAVGVIGGAYGVGGGAIIAPILVSMWNLPIYTTAGATLCGTFLTSLVGVGFFWLAGAVVGVPDVSPDWLLGLSFGVGGLLGTYTGARLQRYVKQRILEGILGVVVTGLGVSYVVGFLLAVAAGG